MHTVGSIPAAVAGGSDRGDEIWMDSFGYLMDIRWIYVDIYWISFLDIQLDNIWILTGYLKWISDGYQRICLGYHIWRLIGYQLDTFWISVLDIRWIFMDILWIQYGYLNF